MPRAALWWKRKSSQTRCPLKGKHTHTQTQSYNAAVMQLNNCDSSLCGAKELQCDATEHHQPLRHTGLESQAAAGEPRSDRTGRPAAARMESRTWVGGCHAWPTGFICSLQSWNLRQYPNHVLKLAGSLWSKCWLAGSQVMSQFRRSLMYK